MADKKSGKSILTGKKSSLSKKKTTKKPRNWWEYSKKEIEDMGPIYPVGNEATVMYWEELKKQKNKQAKKKK